MSFNRKVKSQKGKEQTHEGEHKNDPNKRQNGGGKRCVGAGTLNDANQGEQRLILKVSEANVVPAPMWPYNAHYLKISS